MSVNSVDRTKAYSSTHSHTEGTKQPSAPKWNRSTNAAAPHQRSYEPGPLTHARKEARSEINKAKDPANRAVDGVSFADVIGGAAATTFAVLGYMAGGMGVHRLVEYSGYGASAQALLSPLGAGSAAAAGGSFGWHMGWFLGNELDEFFETGRYAPVPRAPHGIPPAPHVIPVEPPRIEERRHSV